MKIAIHSIKTAVTLSQVPEAGGPFVFHTPLPEAFAMAAELGFDAVELFLPDPYFVSVKQVESLATIHGLKIAAVGTGAGMLRHGLSITDPSEELREKALHFVLSMIDFGAHFKAPAILGSMQGKSTGPDSVEHLVAGLRRCSDAAEVHGVPFLYEPLNRYETNFFNRLGDAKRFLEVHGLDNVALLADLFHMNIEETNLAATIREAGPRIGHVHYADSNRQAMGFGHTDHKQVIAALQDISYSGYLSAEIFPLPDPETAARQTISSVRSVLGTGKI